MVMSNGRGQICKAILEVLGASSAPLKAREIADHLHGRGMPVTKSTVNSILYSELSSDNAVAQDAAFQWSLVNSAERTDSPASVVPVAEPESDVDHHAVSAPVECRAARRVLLSRLC